ncbi:MAG: ABC transporter substrate-binding protein [Propionibacteriaceae bacterium]|nr:ABC transporter substrate-binding protein [Propionibacteriaceae bacterium]
MVPARPRIAAWVLAGLLLTACTSEPVPTPTTPAPLPADTERDIRAEPRDRLRDGGLLRFPIQALPTQWNPRHPDADADTHRVLAALTPAHFTLDAAGRATPNPDFITDVDVQHGDATVVTLTLHERAAWGDATPLTAADWVATWQAASGRVPGVAHADADGWDRVADVRAGATPGTVVVTYAGIDPDWAEPLVAGPLRATTQADAASFSWASYDDARHAAPFMVTHVDAVQGLVTLERNPLWWGDRPKLETITFRTVPDEAVAAAFQHNELDVWETGTSADRLEQSRAAADTSIRSAPGTSGRALVLSGEGTLADPALRQALLLAIDPVEVGVAGLPAGTAEPRAWANTLLLPTQPGYTDQGRATGMTTDPTRAADLLTEAGWVLDDGVRTRDGQPLTVTFHVDPADPRTGTEFDALADQVAAVGITLEPATEGADLTAVSTVVDAFPLAHLPRAATDAPGAAELVARVRTETDAVRRADQAAQLARLLWQEVQVIPLYQEPHFAAVRSDLANLGSPGFGTTSWEDVGWTS